MPFVNEKLTPEAIWETISDTKDSDNRKIYRKVKTGWVEQVINRKKLIINKILFNPTTKEIRIEGLAPKEGRTWKTFSVSSGEKLKVERVVK